MYIPIALDNYWCDLFFFLFCRVPKGYRFGINKLYPEMEGQANPGLQLEMTEPFKDNDERASLENALEDKCYLNDPNVEEGRLPNSITRLAEYAQKFYNVNKIYGNRVVVVIDGAQLTLESRLMHTCLCPEASELTLGFHSPTCPCSCKFCSMVRNKVCMCRSARTKGLARRLTPGESICDCPPFCSCQCASCHHLGLEPVSDETLPIWSTPQVNGSPLYAVIECHRGPYYEENPGLLPPPISYSAHSDFYGDSSYHSAGWIYTKRTMLDPSLTRLDVLLTYASDTTTIDRTRTVVCRNPKCMEPLTPDVTDTLYAFHYCTPCRIEAEMFPRAVWCQCGQEATLYYKHKYLCLSCQAERTEYVNAHKSPSEHIGNEAKDDLGQYDSIGNKRNASVLEGDDDHVELNKAKGGEAMTDIVEIVDEFQHADKKAKLQETLP